MTLIARNNDMGEPQATRVGMQMLGLKFNEFFQLHFNDNDKIIDEIMKWFTDPGNEEYDLFFKTQPNGTPKKVYRTQQGPQVFRYWVDDPTAKELIVLPAKDKQDNPTKFRMNVAIPRDNENLLGGSYLGQIVQDMKALPDNEAEKYALGAITFRRCD